MRFWKRWKALRLLRNRSGIRLDLACGANKQPGFVGMDIRREEGVDIVHDLEEIPWPLPDGCCSLIMASHIMEHVNPARFGFVRVMDECWRVLQPEGQLAIVMPHGRSSGYLQDPTHVNQRNEATWAYFDPDLAGGGLYRIYHPKPWKVESLTWSPEGNMEVLLRKRGPSNG